MAIHLIVPFRAPKRSRYGRGWSRDGRTASTSAATARSWTAIPNDRETGGSYEGVTRMLWGLGSWLSYPDRPAQLEWRGVTYDLEALTYRALVNGCDPDALGIVAL